jgi:hypothetical protein
MVELETPLHFTYYKPTFIREMFEKHAPASTVVAYIDPDIVLKCDWPAFTGWFTEDGISLAEDVNWCFPARHPKRLLWNRFFEPHGATPTRTLDRYYNDNAGFIAVSRQHFEFLDLWRRLCGLVVASNAARAMTGKSRTLVTRSTTISTMARRPKAPTSATIAAVPNIETTNTVITPCT